MADSSYIAVAVRRLAQERARDYCEYCISPAHFSPDSFQFDHIIPTRVGGTSLEDNIHNGKRFWDKMGERMGRIGRIQTDFFCFLLKIRALK